MGGETPAFLLLILVLLQNCNQHGNSAVNHSQRQVFTEGRTESGPGLMRNATSI